MGDLKNVTYSEVYITGLYRIKEQNAGHISYRALFVKAPDLSQGMNPIHCTKKITC